MKNIKKKFLKNNNSGIMTLKINNLINMLNKGKISNKRLFKIKNISKNKK